MNKKSCCAKADTQVTKTTKSKNIVFRLLKKPEVGLVLPRRRLYELYSGFEPFLPPRNTENWGVQKDSIEKCSGIALSDDGHQTESVTKTKKTKRAASKRFRGNYQIQIVSRTPPPHQVPSTIVLL